MNKPAIRRRYLLCKKNKNRKSRMDDEVATDFKLKQFLADVEKFSARSKLRQEKASKQPQPPAKCSQFNDKRGLFENGFLSKATLKGGLSLKNKARLKSNLEKLLGENIPEAKSTENHNDIDDIFDLDDSEPDPDKGERAASLGNSDKSSDWWLKGSKEEEEKNLHVNEDITNKPSTSKNNTDSKKDEISDLIDFANSRAQLEVDQLTDAMKESFKNCKGEQISQVQEQILTLLQQRLLKKLLEKDSKLVENFKLVYEEFKESKKPVMVDKCEQACESEFMNPVKAKGVNPCDKLLFRQEENSFALPFSPTADAQRVNPSSDTLLFQQGEKSFILPFSSTCQTPEQFKNPSVPSNFFGAVDSFERKANEPFNLFLKERSKSFPFLSPEKVIKTPAFCSKDTLPITPPKMSRYFPTPVVQAKPYFPAILSPPSPGRKYTLSPDFICEPPPLNQSKQPFTFTTKSASDRLKERKLTSLSCLEPNGFKPQLHKISLEPSGFKHQQLHNISLEPSRFKHQQLHNVSLEPSGFKPQQLHNVSLKPSEFKHQQLHNISLEPTGFKHQQLHNISPEPSEFKPQQLHNISPEPSGFEPQQLHNISPSPENFHFPKRQRVTFSPHRF